MLKKSLLIGLVLFVVSFASNAQEEKKDKDGPKRNYGVGAGVNFGTINESKTGGITSFYGSFIVNQKLVPFFKLQTGLTYLRTGAILEVDDDAELTLDYLQVPLLLRVKLGPVFLLTGVTGALRVGQSYDGDLDLKGDDFKGHDFTSQLGAGFKFANFTIEGRYNWGKTNILKDSDGVDYHNRYFQLGATMMFL